MGFWYSVAYLPILQYLQRKHLPLLFPSASLGLFDVVDNDAVVATAVEVENAVPNTTGRSPLPIELSVENLSLTILSSRSGFLPSTEN